MSLNRTTVPHVAVLAWSRLYRWAQESDHRASIGQDVFRCWASPNRSPRADCHRRSVWRYRIEAYLEILSCSSELFDYDPITVWQMLLWLCGDHASLKRPINHKPNFLIVVVIGAFTENAVENIFIRIVADQLSGYELIPISRIQAAGDKQQQWCSVLSMWIDDSSCLQIVRFPCNRIVGSGRSKWKSDRIRYAWPFGAFAQT